MTADQEEEQERKKKENQWPLEAKALVYPVKIAFATLLTYLILGIYHYAETRFTGSSNDGALTLEALFNECC